jgi:hypothetical protein
MPDQPAHPLNKVRRFHSSQKDRKYTYDGYGLGRHVILSTRWLEGLIDLIHGSARQPIFADHELKTKLLQLSDMTILYFQQERTPAPFTNHISLEI